MGSHPLNLAGRFLLELIGLFALGRWGWLTGNGAWRFLLGVGLPLLAAALWGTLAVPDDPSRSGKAPVPVAGWMRLLLELLFFGGAMLALWVNGPAWSAWLLGGLVLIHYAISYDRLMWLLQR